MNKQSTPTYPARSSPQRSVVTGTLPHWDHLPPARRRELAATLATLVVKRLVGTHSVGGQHE
jgi:hypothetical protein